MRRTVIAVLAGAALVAGCGGGNDDAGSQSGGGSSGSGAGAGGGAALKVSAPADGALKFDQSELKAKPGKVAIAFSNPSAVPHAVEVEGQGVEAKTPQVTEGDAKVTVDLSKPGTYTFYCPVPGHRAAGMEGRLVVK